MRAAAGSIVAQLHGLAVCGRTSRSLQLNHKQWIRGAMGVQLCAPG